MDADNVGSHEKVGLEPQNWLTSKKLWHEYWLEQMSIPSIKRSVWHVKISGCMETFYRGSHSRSCALLVFLRPSLQLSRNWGSRPHYGPSSGRYSEVCVPSRCHRPGQPRGPGPRYRVHRRHQLLPTAPVEPRHSANRSRAHSWPKNFGAREVFRASGTRRPVQPQPVGIQLRTLHGEAWERRSSHRH